MQAIPRALVADADEASRRLVRLYLERAGFFVDDAKDYNELLAKLPQAWSVALVDARLSPGLSPSELAILVGRRQPGLPIIVLSAAGGISEAVRVVTSGAAWYFQKPFDPIEVVAQSLKFAKTDESQQGVQTTKERSHSAGRYLGSSPSVQLLLSRVQRISAIDSNVLITGESGTGKSLLARIIHEYSNRSSGPFVSLSCAAIPRDLLESELFGHEKGAFTGAVASRTGSIELAEGGTLFLDEVGDLPLELQPKLLLFLQDRAVRRVGSSRETKANVRVIAATHLDLTNMCHERRFREDLFYRLNVLPLSVPPLRERRGDILELVQHSLEKIARERGQQPFTLSLPASEALRTYDWPGNIRELENVIERATAFAGSSVLAPEDLDLAILTDLRASPSKPVPGAETRIVTLAGRSLDEIEREALIQTLEACGGNKTLAASMLGISTKSIYNKMVRLSIGEPLGE